MKPEFYSIFDIKGWMTQKSSNVTLPTMQRGFVWRPAQIEKIWDSILRGFPIGSFLLATYDGDNSNIKELLDGQQRATSISLGLYDPWEEDRDITQIGNVNNLPVVWVDLAPNVITFTSQYVIRVVTQSHPWGYMRNDNSKVLSAADRRSACELLMKAVDAHSEATADENKKASYLKLEPTQRVPYDASVPMPLSWILLAIKTFPQRSDDDIKKHLIDKYRKYFPNGITTKHTEAEIFFEHLESVDFQPIFNAVRKFAQQLNVPAVLIQKDVMVSPDDNAGGDDPTLFVRLNSAGTRLEGEELIYSILKAKKPEIKELVESVEFSVISPAQLVVLCTRLLVSEGTDRGYIKPVKLALFQRWISDEGLHLEDQLHRFIGEPAKQLFKDAVDILKYDGSIPDVVIKQFIRKKPNGLLLLLKWLKANPNHNTNTGCNALKKSEAQLMYRRKICSQLYCTYWFGDIDYYVETIWKKSVNNDFWDQPFRNSKFFTQQPFISPESLQEFLVVRAKEGRNWEITPSEDADIWNLWQASVDADGEDDNIISGRIQEGWLNFLYRLNSQKELILLAQRDYINSTFREFNQLVDLEDTNTPWDWDHIYPYSWVKYQQNIDDRTRAWTNRIGNFRAMSLDENRSENNRLSPFDRLNDEETRKKYFVKDNDWSYWKDIKSRVKKDNANVVEAHFQAIITRTVNIYKDFYDLFVLE